MAKLGGWDTETWKNPHSGFSSVLFSPLGLRFMYRMCSRSAGRGPPPTRRSGLKFLCRFSMAKVFGGLLGDTPEEACLCFFLNVLNVRGLVWGLFVKDFWAAHALSSYQIKTKTKSCSCSVLLQECFERPRISLRAFVGRTRSWLVGLFSNTKNVFSYYNVLFH